MSEQNTHHHISLPRKELSSQSISTDSALQILAVPASWPGSKAARLFVLLVVGSQQVDREHASYIPVLSFLVDDPIIFSGAVVH